MASFRFTVISFFVLLFLSGCTSLGTPLNSSDSHAPISKAHQNNSGLVVTHYPNPSDKHQDEHFPESPYKYMWYYRTEVKNVSDVPVRVVWFDAYVQYEEVWYASNILNRTLRAKDFLNWYAVENPKKEGWIYPGESAVCLVNWHGSKDNPKGYSVKWAYIAVDANGNDYYGEATVESVPIEDDSSTSSDE